MKLFSYFVIAVVGISIIAGFFILGTPQEERLRRFDTQRINDLQSIQSQIITYWQTKEKLPEKLADIENPISGFRSPVDPQTNQNYTYQVKGRLTFLICAIFSQSQVGESITGLTQPKIPPPAQPISTEALNPQKPGVQWNWEHKEGLNCFERAIDPDGYPLLRKGIDERKSIP